MRALGFPVKKEEVKRLMTEYDKEASGRIGWDDFFDISAYWGARCGVASSNCVGRRLPADAERWLHSSTVAIAVLCRRYAMQ
jgi:hypothetical protein